MAASSWILKTVLPTISNLVTVICMGTEPGIGSSNGVGCGRGSNSSLGGSAGGSCGLGRVGGKLSRGLGNLGRFGLFWAIAEPRVR